MYLSLYRLSFRNKSWLSSTAGGLEYQLCGSAPSKLFLREEKNRAYDVALSLLLFYFYLQEGS